MSKHNLPQASRKSEVSPFRSSAAEYLTFVAATGNGNASVERRYEDENHSLTQTMTMQDWEERLGGFLKLWGRGIVQDAGKVSAEVRAA